MTYADIESMKDMVGMNMENRHFTPILLLSRFTDIDNLRTKEASKMLQIWKEELLYLLSSDDAGCVINSGNVLVLIKENRTDEFLKNIKRLRVLTRQSILVTDTMVLSDDISQMFVDYA